MENKSKTVTDTSGREIITRRLLNAPRELVFEAFTQPEHLAKWWGPNGFTITMQEFDLRPGGMWRVILHGPDGHDYPNKMMFVELVKPERIVIKHIGEEPEPVSHQMNILLEEQGDKTNLTLQLVFDTAAERERVVTKYNAIDGGLQTVNRLAEEVVNMFNSPERVISTSRVFDAPRALVYDAWTKPEHLAVWWGPVGFTNTIHEFDLRPGGHWQLTMHGPEAGHYKNHSVFTEVVKNEKLIWYRISEPKFIVKVTFEDAGVDKTKLTFNMHFPTVAGCNKVKKVVLVANEENLDRLAKELTVMAALNN
jgi:uncharacterized protein YndB with AHSA1/START domain